MSDIITCQCGAKIRLPEESANRAFRCPQCKMGIALTLGARPIEDETFAGQDGAMCPICQSAIAAGEAVVTCPKCIQVHHRECWAEIGGCGTYGCEQAPALSKGPATSQPLSAWGDTKKCPFCGETIKSIATRCPLCDTDFGTADPITLADIRRRSTKKDGLKGTRQLVGVLFAVSLIGCFAPLTAIVGLMLLLPRRRDIAKAGPIFSVLAYAAIILSMLYSILMLAFAMY